MIYNAGQQRFKFKGSRGYYFRVVREGFSDKISIQVT